MEPDSEKFGGTPNKVSKGLKFQIFKELKLPSLHKFTAIEAKGCQYHIYGRTLIY